MEIVNDRNTAYLLFNKSVANAIEKYTKITGKNVIFSVNTSEKAKNPDKETVIYIPNPTNHNTIFNVVKELTERTHTDSLNPKKMYSVEIKEDTIEKYILPFLQEHHSNNSNIQILAVNMVKSLLHRLITYPKLVSIMNEIGTYYYTDLADEIDYFMLETSCSVTDLLTPKTYVPDIIYESNAALIVALFKLLGNMTPQNWNCVRKIQEIEHNNIHIKEASRNLCKIFLSDKYGAPKFVYYGVITRLWARSLGISSWFKWTHGSNENSN